MSEPKITVIVPTRERCDVLEWCLRTLTAQDYDNLEILVSDNFSSDATADVVLAASDPRIRYVKTERRLSMSHNWEFAISHVTDGWVTFIGDDDGLPLGAVDKVSTIVKERDVRAVRSTFAAYQWPEVAGEGHGHLLVPKGTGIEMRKSSVWLRLALEGKARYTDLPMLYNGGFTDIRVLREIKAITGRHFNSLSPDVYTAVAVARIVDTYAFSFEPLAISGVSRHSTGTSFYSKSRTRQASSSQKFLEEENLPFHADLPLCDDGSYPLSLHSLVYEAYLQSSAIHSNTLAIDQTEQLEIILASSGKHRASILAWGKRFANLHALDYRKARRNAFLMAFAIGWRSAFSKFRSAINSYYAGSQELPVANVYQASIAMATIQHTSTYFGALYAEIRRRTLRR